MNQNELSFQTLLVHNKHSIDPSTGAVSVPIQHASTFHQFNFDQFGQYDYSRSGNPTRDALEQTIAELENGVRGFAFASGMAAISTAFMLFSKGDHVLVTEDVYGGTYRLVTQVLSRFGIEYTFVDMTDLDQVKKSIRPNTKVIYIETPSNPTLKITDIRAIVDLAKTHGCLTFIDNTFLTPALQQPLELGVDLVLHSATKFIAGHSDVIAGLAVVKDEELGQKLYFLQNTFGSILGPQDAWLILRGIKTLHVRLKQSQESAMEIAKYLQQIPQVEQVYYPGLREHKGFEVQQSQAKGAGAVLSFRLKDEQAVRTFVKEVKIPVFAVSLGAVESILSYPAKMSHAAMPKEEREKRGITDGLLRLSVGLENPRDLLADFEQAFSKLNVKYNL
ncbi:cystathionine beta-lyase [Tepidibacillus sp. HK-1]|uniref:cystathionine beta-lyase n=1 Tax=Tepidibacillus sp. HK-1 TaxID=1883407 RepID=UPI0008531D1E|nr:cystathionine beta-lyase [Tepidibacillus sp. HK-1]GBF10348.1 cystathionine beta-lyase MetC [Tepidibacillus sp. HK-1]